MVVGEAMGRQTEPGSGGFGADGFDSGEIRIDGGKVNFSGPRDAMRQGMSGAFVSCDCATERGKCECVMISCV